ncbi:hypothetical protein O9929_17750 [Vibrio lentus]|nr:hypothetical protein [Vibrio lentus]
MFGPEDISPQQFAEMIDGAVKVAGIDHVGIATDDMMTTVKVVPFAVANADKYALITAIWYDIQQRRDELCRAVKTHCRCCRCFMK